MKLLSKDFKKGEVKIQVTSLDDLWFLSHIVDEEDKIKGKTFRKIKIGEGTDRNLKVVKKPVYLKIDVEKIEFHKFSNSLRISGKISEGTEDIPKGSYHTFDVHEDTIITIIKKKWLKYQRDKLEDACSESHESILIVVMDREEASFALLTSSGYKMLTELKGEVEKKGYKDVKGKDFYGDLTKSILEYVVRFKVQNIIIGSPVFWKEELFNVLKKKDASVAKMVTLATANNIGKTGVEEILKRDEVKSVLKQDRTAKETALVEDVFKEVSKDGPVAYGLKDVKEACDAGAIKILLVTDDFVHEKREEGTYLEIDNMMKSVDNTKGDIHIISTDHDAGKKLDGLGGIAAILRYKLKY